MVVRQKARPDPIECLLTPSSVFPHSPGKTGRVAPYAFGGQQLVRIATVIKIKRKRLEARGWKIGFAREFLDLNDQEEVYMELRLKLADALKRQRIRRNLTQGDVAKTVGSSQPSIIEAGDGSVSLGLLVRSLIETPASNNNLAKNFGRLGALQKSARRVCETPCWTHRLPFTGTLCAPLRPPHELS